MEELTLEEWYDLYEPLENEDGEIIDFDLERNKLKEFGSDYIWTEVDCENEECYILNGLHIVNKSRIFITKNPWKEETEVNCNEMISIGKAKYACLDFLNSIGIELTPEQEDKLHDFYSGL
jgi:hypothetical protein